MTSGCGPCPGLWRACSDLLRRERFDALFITTYPTYPALLGPRLKRAFRIPFVLDYQDPWVGAWGKTVGGGPNGAVDLKSRLARALAAALEGRVARAADAIIAVSSETHEQVRRRHPAIEMTPCAAIPLGGEATDFDRLRSRARANPYFDPADGHVHVCCVGTLAPLGRRDAARRARRRRRCCAIAGPTRTDASTCTSSGPAARRQGRRRPRVLPIARELGVADRVTEVASARRLPGRAHDPDAGRRAPRDGEQRAALHGQPAVPGAARRAAAARRAITRRAASSRSCAGLPGRPRYGW